MGESGEPSRNRTPLTLCEELLGVQNQPLTAVADGLSPSFEARCAPIVPRLLRVIESAVRAGDHARALEYLDRVRAELGVSEQAETLALSVVRPQGQP